VRRLVVVCALQLAAAAALEGAVRLGVGAGLRGFALLALAGVAATVALAGVARRMLGALLAAAGVAGAFAMSGTGGTVLAALGIALLVAAGGALLVAERSLARPGARYASRGADRREIDPDRRAWEELDAGRDPTQGQAGDSAV
jgi:hypothetical protein